MKKYVMLLIMYKFNARLFIENAVKTKWSIALIHFIFVIMIIFLPIFILIVKTQPYELFPRAYGVDTISSIDTVHAEIDFSQYGISIHSQNGYVTNVEVYNDKAVEFNVGNSIVAFSNNINIDNISVTKQNKFYISGDIIVYANQDKCLITSVNNISTETMQALDIKEMFNIISIANNYFSEFMVSVLMFLLVIVIALQIIFIPTIAYLTGYSRLKFVTIPFLHRLKIVIFSLTLPAVASCIIGFLLPIIHLFLFQAITVGMVIFIFKKYDNDKPNSKYLL